MNIQQIGVNGNNVTTMSFNAVLPSSAPAKSIPLNTLSTQTFLSDTIFGTTDYSSNTAPFTEALILINEINGSFLLPRIIGYNLQLQGFDDTLSYGNQEAYLSLSTGGLNIYTLRWEANGNLAIYNSPDNAPVWQTNTQSSNRYLKKDIKPIENALEKIQAINGIKFNYIHNPFKCTKSVPDVGVIAQEILSIIPEAVYGSEDKSYGVYLEKIIPHLIGAMQEIYRKQEIIINDNHH